MLTIGFIIGFFILRGELKAQGGGFTASLVLFFAFMCAFSGMWVFAAGLGLFAFYMTPDASTYMD